MNHSRRSLTTILSVVTALLCMGLSMLAIRMTQNQQEDTFLLGDFSNVKWEDSLDTFQNSQSSQDLVELLKVLCYRAEVEQDAAAEPLIKQYGTLLYDRARAGEVDLSTLGDDETMLELLRLIQSYGAK